MSDTALVSHQDLAKRIGECFSYRRSSKAKAIEKELFKYAAITVPNDEILINLASAIYHLSQRPKCKLGLGSLKTGLGLYLLEHGDKVVLEGLSDDLLENTG